MKAKIADKKEIAEETLEVTFDLIGETAEFKAGQFFTLELLNPPYTDEKGNHRHFTIVNAPSEKNKLIMATRIRETGFKKSLKELPLGSEVEIGNIAGLFTLPSEENKELVFIAGGIGITPFISMLRHIRQESLKYKISLFYFNRNPKATAYLQELETVAQELPDFQPIFAMTGDESWTGEKAKMSPELLHKYLTSLSDKTYFISGPPKMVDEIKKVLIDSGISLKNIKTESFTGY